MQVCTATRSGRMVSSERLKRRQVRRSQDATSEERSAPHIGEAGVLTLGPCLRFPSSVSPHGTPSNSAQQGNMRQRTKMRVGS